MAERIAAYTYLFVAGLATEFLAYAVLGEWHEERMLLSLSSLRLVFEYLLPGIAAVLAALAVHRPYACALQGKSRLRLYGWMLLGVLLAHVVLGGITSLYGYLFWTDEGVRVFTLETAVTGAAYFAVFSLLLGGIPNLLFAATLTEFALWLERRAAPY